MRGRDLRQDALFSYISPEARVPRDHPLRTVREITDRILRRLSPQLGRLYARTGRPSVPPEQLLRALLLQALYSIRSERLLVEALDYNLLFRWFVGLSLDDPVWDPTTFTKNRQRLLAGEVAQRFFQEVVSEARGLGLLSDEHFTVDSTLLEAWASLKSLQPADPPPPRPARSVKNPSVNFRGQRRSNQTHRSTTDPDARLARRGPGREAKLCYQAHLLVDNRHGLAVAACVTHPSGTADRHAALRLLRTTPPRRYKTLGADRAYDVRSFVQALRAQGITPHIAQNTTRRRSALDRRTTRHRTYHLSQLARPRVEEIFGWLKTTALLRKLRHRGLPLVQWIFTFAAAAYNLVRIRNLCPQLT
uniref:Transposase n=1 Tax=uncultured prokaryote TaxID=198431 RepID=H5SLU0_9ZZZZ|nr:transposase [uncultured prokaryote]